MMAASLLSNTKHDILLIEKNEKLGKKIYITGKGRCNFTNACSNDEFIKNVVSNPRFLYSAIENFSAWDTIDFFESKGMATKLERGNRMFPESDKSNDVIKALSKFGDNVKVLLNTTVTTILTQDNSFIVKTDDSEYIVDKVVLATGGLSYPSTGSTGDGYRFAKKLGHTVTELHPALVSLVSDDLSCKRLEGLSLKNVDVTLYADNQKVGEEFGEMLFTAHGVSGPCILTLSSLLSKRSFKECYITIDFKPALSFEALEQRVMRDFSENNNKSFKNSLDALLPKSLIPVIIDKCGINPDKKINQITAKERQDLVKLLKDFRLNITNLGPFTQAVITSGGINVKEINPKTMESKLVPGLYIIGEILDVDAYTGGFNLQIAFSTAASAVKDILGGIL